MQWLREQEVVQQTQLNEMNQQQHVLRRQKDELTLLEETQSPGLSRRCNLGQSMYNVGMIVPGTSLGSSGSCFI